MIRIDRVVAPAEGAGAHAVRYLSEFRVEAAVDDGVVGRVRHGEPVARERRVVDARPRPQLGHLVAHDLRRVTLRRVTFFSRCESLWRTVTHLEHVERQPAEGEEEDDDDHHLDHLC